MLEKLLPFVQKGNTLLIKMLIWIRALQYENGRKIQILYNL